MNEIVLFGATGQQGQAITQKLLEAQFKIVAPVRSIANAASLAREGLAFSATDFSIPSLEKLMKDADGVVVQIPVLITPDEMVSLARTILTAIKNIGAPHTVFVISSAVPTSKTGFANPDARLAMKLLVNELVPQAVVLSATIYLENFSQAYRQAISQGVIPQAIATDVPVSYISLSDLGTYVVAPLNHKHMRGTFQALSGREALTGREVEQRMTRYFQRQISYVPISIAQLIDALTPMLGATIAQQIAEMYTWEAASGSALLNPPDSELKKLVANDLDFLDKWLKRSFPSTDAV